MGAADKVSIHPDEITAQAPTFATERQLGRRPAPDAQFAPHGWARWGSDEQGEPVRLGVHPATRRGPQVSRR